MKRIFLLLMLVLVIVNIQSNMMRASAEETPPMLTMLASESEKKELDRCVQIYYRKTGSWINVEYIKDDEYMDAVNTRILAGEGPDIICATWLPFWSYADARLLADIGELIENDPDIDLNDYHVNIIDPLRVGDGRLYALPCSFYFQDLMVNTPLLEKYGLERPTDWTIQSVTDMAVTFSDITEKAPDVYAGLTVPFDFFEHCVKDEIKLSVDFCKGRSAVESIPVEVFESLNLHERIRRGFTLNIISSQAEKKAIYYSGVDKVLLYESNMYLGSLWSAPVRTYIDYIDFEFLPAPRADMNAGASYIPRLIFCVNRQGNVPKAWEFLKMMLGEEVQNDRDIVLNPVFKSATEARLSDLRAELLEVQSAVESGTSFFELVDSMRIDYSELDSALEKFILHYKNRVSSLSVPMLNDHRFSASVEAVVARDPNGRVDAGRVKNEVERIADVYLSESGGNISRGYTVIYIVAAIAAVILIGLIISRMARKKERNAKKG